MKKYLSIIKISLAQELAYKLNFIVWRIRNIIQILVFFFLWTSVFADSYKNLFGYSKEMIVAYTFLLIFIRALVLSSKSTDASGHISNGDLSNYLIKPISYFKYLITRDISTKLLNITCSFFEIIILLFILRPNIYLQTNPVNLILFLISIFIAMFIFFNIVMIANSVSFWVPELGWGAHFLILVVMVEFLSGAFFPLDVFPNIVLNLLKLTPFPYLVFVPIKIYLTESNIVENLVSIVVGGTWSVVLWFLMNNIWSKGLKRYEAVGR